MQRISIRREISKLIFNAISYSTGIINSLREKTFTAMAELRGVSHDQVRRELVRAQKEIPEVRAHLRRDVQKKVAETSGGGALILNTTAAVKEHAKAIEGLSREHVGSRRVQGVKIALFCWTDMQEQFLPIDLLVPAAIPNFKNKSMVHYAITLAQIIGVHTMLLDAAFATIDAFGSLKNTGLCAVMRFHCNRVVSIAGFGKHQLQKHPAFIFERNQRCIVREVVWHDMSLRVIALKVHNKRAKSQKKKWKILFLVTNAPMEKALQYAEYYKYRWGIEPFIRTIKQSYGLQDSQARSIGLQEAHFFASCLAYHEQMKNQPQNTTSVRHRVTTTPLKRKIRKPAVRRARTNRMNYAIA